MNPLRKNRIAPLPAAYFIRRTAGPLGQPSPRSGAGRLGGHPAEGGALCVVWAQGRLGGRKAGQDAGRMRLGVLVSAGLPIDTAVAAGWFAWGHRPRSWRVFFTQWAPGPDCLGRLTCRPRPPCTGAPSDPS